MKILFDVTKQLIIVTLDLGIQVLQTDGDNKNNQQQSESLQNTETFEYLRILQNYDNAQQFLHITPTQQQLFNQNNQNSDENEIQSQSTEQFIPQTQKEENTSNDNNLKQNSQQENKEIMIELQEKQISQQDFPQDNQTLTQKNEQPQDIDQNIEVNEPIEEFKEQEQDQPIEQIQIQQQNNQEKQQNNDSEQEVSPQINQQSSAIEQNNDINKENNNNQQQQQPIEKENNQEEQQNNDSEQEVSPQIKEQSPAIEKNNDINNDQQQQQPIEQENNQEKQQNNESEQQDDSTQINEQSSAIEQNNDINKTIEEENEQQQQQPILEQVNNQDKQQNNDKLQETINLLNKIFDTSYRGRAVDVQYKNFVSEQMSQTELINYYFPSKKNQYKKQIQGIKQELIGYRRIRGDGNCFYTAFAFQYFQILLTDKQRREQFEQKISTLKVSINYQQIKIENNEDIPKLFLDEFQKVNDEKELLDQMSDPDKLFYGLSIIVLRNYIVDLYQNNEEIRSLGNNFIVPEILEWEKECNTNELIITLLAEELKLIITVHFFDLKNNTYNKTKYGEKDQNLELPQIILLLAPGHYQVGILKK